MESPPESELFEHVLHRALEGRCSKPGSVSYDWIRNVLANADAISGSIGRELWAKNLRSLKVNSSQGFDVMHLLQERLVAAGQLVCTTTYVKQCPVTVQGIEGQAAIEAAAEKLINHEFPEANGTQEIYGTFLKAREQAISGLREALDLLNSELELARLNSRTSAEGVNKPENGTKAKNDGTAKG
jgi:hypothetical protein